MTIKHGLLEQEGIDIMRIVVISDTHSFHRQVNVPDGDVFIHAGDITGKGELSIVEDFCNWINHFPHRKIVIYGNHDMFEHEPKRSIASRMITDAGAIHLHDSEVVIDGVKFYGSPFTPVFYDWAWNLPRGNALAEKWSHIPDDVSVLCTHCPPYGILDRAPRGIFDYEHVGCQDLLDRILELRHLKTHVFGHIHFEGGKVFDDYGVKFANAAICTEQYKPTNLPTVIDI